MRLFQVSVQSPNPMRIYRYDGWMFGLEDWSPLDKAVDEREGLTLHFHIDPLFDPLRSHPRYHALLRKMNLEP